MSWFPLVKYLQFTNSPVSESHFQLAMVDEEEARRLKRAALKELNVKRAEQGESHSSTRWSYLMHIHLSFRIHQGVGFFIEEAYCSNQAYASVSGLREP